MSAPTATCDLCGLPLRRGGVTFPSQGRTFHFCCMGCRQVFQMLMEAGDHTDPAAFKETELFRKCREIGLIPKTVEDLEPPGPARNAPPTPQENTLSLNLRIGGMWCPACAWVIGGALNKHEGVLEANCHFSTDRVQCRYDPVKTSPPEIIHTIENLGYTASLPGDRPGQGPLRREFIRFAVSAFLTLNVMMLSFGLYAGFFTEFSRETVSRLSWPIFIMASIVLFYGGQGILKRAWAGLFHAAMSMETLITAGSLSAYLYSTYNLIFVGSIHLYYDTASMLITLVLLGKALEGRARRGVQEGLETLFSLRPTKARICSEAFPEGRYVSAEHLEKGDKFQATEGEIVPADGPVLEGTGSVDESTLTGESAPITKKPGQGLQAGTRVLHGTFRVRAERVGEEATFGQMIRIMEKALGSKAGFEGKTDVLLQWFVPVVLLLAVGTGVACLMAGLSQGEAIVRAVTVMVISCPCTLGVAVPLARVAGISIAGRQGLLVRNFQAFEQAGRISAFVFDKTGTLTEGQWEVMRIETCPPFEEDQALALAAALEKELNHTIALSILKRAGERHIEPAGLEDVRQHKNGITGRFEGREVKIGSRDFLADCWKAAGAPGTGGGAEEEVRQSVVYMVVDGRPCARFLFGDRIRAGASRTVRALLDQGQRVALISGDHERTTRAVGKAIGLQEAHGAKSPEEKATFIQGLQGQGFRVAMVGDGINDAPALARADLAVSIQSGHSLNHEASDLTLMRGEPGQVLDFLGLAARVNRKIHQNLACSFVYNLVSIPVAMSGMLTPLIAVCAMLMSSLAVTGNTLLLVKKKDRNGESGKGRSGESGDG